jgi:hypothetical protein
MMCLSASDSSRNAGIVASSMTSFPFILSSWHINIRFFETDARLSIRRRNTEKKPHVCVLRRSKQQYLNDKAARSQNMS